MYALAHLHGLKMTEPLQHKKLKCNQIEKLRVKKVYYSHENNVQF